MLRKRLKLAAALLAALAVAVSLGVAYMRLAPHHTPAGQSPLVSLTEGKLEPLEKAFNTEPSSTRILLMLSPT